MKTELRKLSEIKPYPGNPRDNTKAVELVMDSIKKFGYLQPIAVDKNNVIITGHTRYEALRKLRKKSVEVIVLDLPEDVAAKYRLVDNKTHEYSFWDMDKLKQELREYSEGLDIFFEGWDFEKMLQEDFGISRQPIDKKGINTTEQKIENTFQQPDVYRTVHCPKCGKPITVKPK